MPVCDFVEKGDHFEVCAELPGFRREDVQVTVDGNRLTIKAEHAGSAEERSGEDTERGWKWHRVERRSGALYRSFRMPTNADLERVSARSENGVLTVLVPKKMDVPGEARKTVAIE
jgi:HSP20 family protein